MLLIRTVVLLVGAALLAANWLGSTSRPSRFPRSALRWRLPVSCVMGLHGIDSLQTCDRTLLTISRVPPPLQEGVAFLSLAQLLRRKSLASGQGSEVGILIFQRPRLTLLRQLECVGQRNRGLPHLGSEGECFSHALPLGRISSP